MAAVKHVGVRELREELAGNLQGNTPIVIERHGKVSVFIYRCRRSIGNR
jgi:hypothetical protein